MPIRGPTATGPGSPGASSNGGWSIGRLSRSPVTPSAWHNLPGPAHRSLTRAPAADDHSVQAPGRLESSYQHRASRRPGVADDVQTPVQPVDAVDIGAADGTEHRRVARGRAPKTVRGGVEAVVGLGLDDDAAYAVDEQGRPDQGAGRLRSRPPQKIGQLAQGRAERSMRSQMRAMIGGSWAGSSRARKPRGAPASASAAPAAA